MVITIHPFRDGKKEQPVLLKVNSETTFFAVELHVRDVARQAVKNIMFHYNASIVNGFENVMTKMRGGSKHVLMMYTLKPNRPAETPAPPPTPTPTPIPFQSAPEPMSTETRL